MGAKLTSHGVARCFGGSNMKLLKNNLKYIIDILILVFGIMFTLHVEDKFDNYTWVKDNYWFWILILGIMTIGLSIWKLILAGN